MTLDSLLILSWELEVLDIYDLMLCTCYYYKYVMQSYAWCFQQDDVMMFLSDYSYDDNTQCYGNIVHDVIKIWSSIVMRCLMSYWHSWWSCDWWHAKLLINIIKIWYSMTLIPCYFIMYG